MNAKNRTSTLDPRKPAESTVLDILADIVTIANMNADLTENGQRQIRTKRDAVEEMFQYIFQAAVRMKSMSSSKLRPTLCKVSTENGRRADIGSFQCEFGDFYVNVHTFVWKGSLRKEKMMNSESVIQVVVDHNLSKVKKLVEKS